MKILKVFTDRNFNLKLKTQLIASFLFMTLLIVSVIAALVYSSVMSILKKQSEELVTRQFRQAEYNIDNFRDQLEKLAGLLAINKDVQNFINMPDGAVGSARIVAAKDTIKALDDILGAYPYVYEVSLYCSGGEALSDSATGSWYRQDAQGISPFYSSVLYQRIKEKMLGFIWSSQPDSAMFGLADEAPEGNPLPFMTVVRNVNVLGRANRSAVLAISVKQSEFGSIYNSENSTVSNTQYLIDDQGYMVSNSDPSQIGKREALADHIDLTRTNGSFSMEIGGHSKQITYYQIKNTGWILVNETPETEFTRNIMILRRLIGIMLGVALVLALLLSVYWIYRVTRPFNHLVYAMREMEKGNLGIMLDETPSTELGLIGRRFNKMSMSIEELISENRTIEAQKRKLEMEALQSQINPHFLYNALNTIKWTAMVRKEHSIVDSITTLGNMLRSIYKERSLTTSLQEEMAYIENYLKIMNARYGEGVKISVSVPEELLACQIIRFILQPIVENAFIHGMQSKSYNGSIEIAAREEDGVLLIAVKDNGCGISPETLAAIRKTLRYAGSESEGGGSIGLFNVHRRIQMQYGPDYGLSIESRENEGAEVTLRLPILE